MRKGTKKEKRKLEFNEKLQLWSDRIVLIISIVLCILTGINLMIFFG